MDWWMIGGMICTGLFLVLSIPAGILLVRARRAFLVRLARLETEGRVVKAWIVFAHDQLYKRNPPRRKLPAQLVYFLDPSAPNSDERLSDLAAAVADIEVINADNWEERYIRQVMVTKVPYSYPLLIPGRLTDGLRAFTATVDIPCRVLADGTLARPYVWVKSYDDPDPNNRIAQVVEYPDEAGEGTRT